MTLFWYIYFTFVVLNASVIYILWKTGNLGDYLTKGDIAMMIFVTLTSFFGTIGTLIGLFCAWIDDRDWDIVVWRKKKEE